MVLCDTHTHLYAEEFQHDISLAIARATEAGIHKLFLPNIDSSSVSGMMELVRLFPGVCYPMMGLHPCSVKENWKEELTLVKTRLKEGNFSGDKKTFYGIGEVGLDLYWDRSFAKEQEHAFQEQVALALQYDLPVIIHNREAFDRTFSIVKNMQNGKLKGIFHCFTGSLHEAEQIIALDGFWLGIGGVLTFKNSGLASVVEKIDMAHIVLETDSPYLAPVPYRGKRNESAYLRIIAQGLADIKRTGIEDVAEASTRNVEKIFGIEISS